jgi:hypothetical protein
MSALRSPFLFNHGTYHDPTHNRGPHFLRPFPFRLSTRRFPCPNHLRERYLVDRVRREVWAKRKPAASGGRFGGVLAMKRLCVIACLALCACESAEEKALRFGKLCIEHEFTVKQCQMLYAMKQAAEDDASNATAMSAFAIGMGTVNSGSRR